MFACQPLLKSLKKEDKMNLSLRFTLITSLIAVLVIGFSNPAAALFGKNKFELEVEKEQAAVKLSREVTRGGYALVTTSELKQWIDNGREMVILDTMPYEASYKKSHIPGAKQMLFPIPEMNQWDSDKTGNKTQNDFKSLLGDDPNRTIVIYCGFVKCTRSHNGAMWARKLGYRNVYRYSGGIFAWKGADFATASVK